MRETTVTPLPARQRTGDSPLRGAGLGLRRLHFDDLLHQLPAEISFMEVAPENWIEVGGRGGRQFRAIAERIPIVCHGLALDLGGLAPIDETFLLQVKRFLDEIGAPVYSEHLSYCGDHGHLYDLLPIPFTWEAVRHVAARIRRVQEILERRIAVENTSYYATPGREIAEIDFINAVIEEADCLLHLDVNNVYVNSVNHGFDAADFLCRLPGHRIAYAHIAGHFRRAEDLIVDTHGADVVAPVWSLLDLAYQRFGVFPTLLERDFDIPPLAEMLPEVRRIATVQASALADAQRAPARAVAAGAHP
ncbi:MAG: DUF692 domain-containing protein [Gammaproteobacteria bacterium]